MKTEIKKLCERVSLRGWKERPNGDIVYEFSMIELIMGIGRLARSFAIRDHEQALNEAVYIMSSLFALCEFAYLRLDTDARKEWMNDASKTD